MLCKKCKKEIPAESAFCNYCGTKQIAAAQKQHRRTKGTGYIYKRGLYWYIRTVNHYEVKDGRVLRKTKSKGGFKTKKEAEMYLPELLNRPTIIEEKITFQKLYEQWLPLHEAKVSKSTMDCYRSAYKHFEPIYYYKFCEIKTATLQDVIDKCPHGVRTKENMKALGTLLYTYAIQNDLVDKNYASFVYIDRKAPKKKRGFFTQEERKILWDNVYKVPFTEWVLCLMYTGLRPNEFLKLKPSDLHGDYIIGGSKTEAGIDRAVTLSPKILPFFQAAANKGNDYLFTVTGGKLGDKKFREIYYNVLSQCNIEKREPYCCRHTFATMMGETSGTDAAKTELMGHTNIEMTKHYTHAELESLRSITNQLV